MTEQNRSQLISLKKRLQKDIDTLDILLGTDGKSSWEVFQNMNKWDQGQYIISGVCDFYEITKKDFLKKSANALIVRRRQYALQIMNDYTELEQELMADLLGFHTHANANIALQNMADWLSPEAYGRAKMRAVYQSIVEYLGFPLKNN